MRMGELAAQAGLPIASVKFYLREGLLPPGEATAKNQARYGPAHLERLQLIKTLQEVGGLSLASIQAVLEALEGNEGDLWEGLGRTVDRLSPEPPPAPPELHAWVDAFLAELGWQLRPEASGRRRLAAALHRAMAATEAQGAQAPEPGGMRLMAEALSEIARMEVGMVEGPLRAGGPQALMAIVRGTVLWEPVWLELRRLAHEHHTKALLTRPPGPEGPPTPAC